MCLHSSPDTYRVGCTAFSQKTDGVINVKVEFCEGKVPLNNIVKRDLGLPRYDAPNAGEELKQLRKQQKMHEKVKNGLRQAETETDQPNG